MFKNSNHKQEDMLAETTVTKFKAKYKENRIMTLGRRCSHWPRIYWGSNSLSQDVHFVKTHQVVTLQFPYFSMFYFNKTSLQRKHICSHHDILFFKNQLYSLLLDWHLTSSVPWLNGKQHLSLHTGPYRQLSRWGLNTHTTGCLNLKHHTWQATPERET